MAFARIIHSRASEDRREALIQERLVPGADKSAIDKRIWRLFGEKWAVLYTDLSGFSRNVAAFGIIHFLQTIYESHHLLVPVIRQHNGILLKTEGDSLIVIFRDVDDAVRCAVAMQHCCRRHGETLPPEEKVLLCLGIGYGGVLRIGDQDVFSAEVNSACKLGEDFAQAHDILATAAVANAASLPQGVRLEPLDAASPGIGAAFRIRYAGMSNTS